MTRDAHCPAPVLRRPRAGTLRRPRAGTFRLAARGILECLAVVVCLALACAAPSGAADPPPPLVRPLGGDLVRAFDGPGKPWLAGHRGVDLRGEVGDAVLAAAQGRVAFVGHVVDRDVISIDHAGGYRTTYQSVRAVVTRGQQVRAGETIGHLEQTTECDTTCLHWGLRLGPDYLDPMAWLASVGVRLLPEGARPAAPPAAAAPPMMPLLTAPPGTSSGLRRPVAAPITSPFGMRFHPILHVWKLHDGTDFGAACGTPISSAAAGRVVQVATTTGYGNRVVVDHGTIAGHRIRTAYNHLQAFWVSQGQVVTQGQTIGAVGTTGRSTGCHLHFMTWRDDELVNPMAELS